jgi:hypothetical protein
MKPGMAVRGKVVTEQRPDVALVARDSVIDTPAGPAVLRPGADQGGTAALTPIHPVARNSMWYVLDEEKDAPLIAELGLGLPPASSVGRLSASGVADAEPPLLAGRAANTAEAP